MNRLQAAITTLIIAGLVGSAAAADPTGVWRSTSRFPSQMVEGTLQLWVDREGPILGGYYFYGANRRGLEITPASFNEEDGQVNIAVEHVVNGERFIVRHSGTLRGNTITGQCSVEGAAQKQSATWIARRQN